MKPFLGFFAIIVFSFALIPSFSKSETITSLRQIPKNIDYDGDWSPDGQKLVFVSNRNGPFNLYTINADGSNIQQLTNHEGSDDQPSFSPDGTKIAFTSDIDGNIEIYTIGVDGTGMKRLTSHSGYDIHPFWSPDGEKIIFNSTRERENQNDPDIFEIYLMNTDGTEKIRITQDLGVSTYAAFSPNGKSIVYRKIIGENNSEIFSMDLDGTNQKNLSQNESFDGWPYWSPNGKKITFASNRDGNYEIYIMNADGSQQTKLFAGPGRQTVPRISPDGTKMTFTRSSNGEARVLIVGIEPTID